MHSMISVLPPVTSISRTFWQTLGSCTENLFGGWKLNLSMILGKFFIFGDLRLNDSFKINSYGRGSGTAEMRRRPIHARQKSEISDFPGRTVKWHMDVRSCNELDAIMTCVHAVHIIATDYVTDYVTRLTTITFQTSLHCTSNITHSRACPAVSTLSFEMFVYLIQNMGFPKYNWPFIKSWI